MGNVSCLTVFVCVGLLLISCILPGECVVSRYRAAWVLPMTSPPIPGGVVSIEHDLIASVGGFDGGVAEDLGHVAILPGLVNAHTHLELSWMRGQVAPGTSMPAWAASLMAMGRRVAPAPPEPLWEALADARCPGTGCIGERT